MGRSRDAAADEERLWPTAETAGLRLLLLRAWVLCEQGRRRCFTRRETQEGEQRQSHGERVRGRETGDRIWLRVCV